MKARRHEIHTLETPEANEGRGTKEHVEFEPTQEHARHKTREVQEHLRHVRHESTFATRHVRQKVGKAREAREHVGHEST